MFEFLIAILGIVLFAGILGYTLVVLKEKYYLKNNIIFIDNRYISQDEIEDTDMQEFFLDGTKLKAGDGISIMTKSKEKFKGILIGAVNNDQSIKMVTYANEVIKLKIESINQFRIMSKYGKFFS
ncbi:hypothetical protein [Gudongella sp. DL1XJH-153]|uniref:hypothetical protein n=1 Tax=Gudongella sp. DL1XJH-153 TaxID=3409804 RepID=UPI003BB772C3